MIKRALISVSDKTGLVDLAQGLHELGVELVSTGGTARAIAEAGLPVRQVSDLTGFPEILAGRVKTLHPAVFAGILYRRDQEGDRDAVAKLGYGPIDLVVVNLYPFRETIRKPGVRREEAIEEIDIGGPSMLRAAAKNYQDVAVVVEPQRYPELLRLLKEKGDFSLEYRLSLARDVFRHTALYDAAIASYLGQETGEEEFPQVLVRSWERAELLRYGENPHQMAAFYRDPEVLPGSLAGASKLQGKELSYNNLADAEAALGLLREFGEPAAVAVKHQNPCGVAIGTDVLDAYRQAHASDPVSIFGGIVAVNRPVDQDLARELAQTFLEIVLAPSFTPEALEVLRAKKNLRLLTLDTGRIVPGWEYRAISGGLLVQERDLPFDGRGLWTHVAGPEPEADVLEELWFAWRVVKHQKSNAIAVTKDGVTLGLGNGQTNRVDSARIALAKAGDKARGAVLASDAFFPFPDTVEEAVKAGIKAIVQPGGSKNDEASIAVAEAAGITMLLTGRRHFKH